jgi:hypothetical protein
VTDNTGPLGSRKTSVEWRAVATGRSGQRIQPYSTTETEQEVRLQAKAMRQTFDRATITVERREVSEWEEA